MENLRIRIISLISILLITWGFIQLFSYTPNLGEDAATKALIGIPEEFSTWKGVDIFLDETVYEILETRDIIHRNYTSNGQNVFLSIVYYPETKVDFHAPEGCLAGKGIQISKSTKSIDIFSNNEKIKLEVNQLIRSTNSGEEVIYYFYKAGDFIGDNYIKLRFNLVFNKFIDTNKSGALIRYSTPIKPGDYNSAHNILNDFINDLYPFLIQL